MSDIVVKTPAPHHIAWVGVSALHSILSPDLHPMRQQVIEAQIPLPPSWDTWTEFLTPVLAWPNSGCCRN